MVMVMTQSEREKRLARAAMEDCRAIVHDNARLTAQVRHCPHHITSTHDRLSSTGVRCRWWGWMTVWWRRSKHNTPQHSTWPTQTCNAPVMVCGVVMVWCGDGVVCGVVMVPSHTCAELLSTRQQHSRAVQQQVLSESRMSDVQSALDRLTADHTTLARTCHVRLRNRRVVLMRAGCGGGAGRTAARQGTARRTRHRHTAASGVMSCQPSTGHPPQIAQSEAMEALQQRNAKLEQQVQGVWCGVMWCEVLCHVRRAGGTGAGSAAPAGGGVGGHGRPSPLTSIHPPIHPSKCFAPPPNLMAHAAEVARICGPGSHVVAVGCYDEHVRVYDLARQSLAAQIRLPGNVYRVAFIPDSPLLLVSANKSERSQIFLDLQD